MRWIVDVDRRRRRKIIVTAVIIALLALGFYVGFFISISMR
ncbi:hypothetical protein [Thioalkalivibrio thiocyanodenitrificans]|nr:hypothetical protein [Thioalkalivibrio thiocyanodenitrificans]